MRLLVKLKDLSLNGFIAPGHVSTIIGLRPYEVFPKQYAMPVVVAGFEPLDLMFGIYMIVRQLHDGKPKLENEYNRAVNWEGNVKAQKLMNKVFSTVDGTWRGLGIIPESKFVLKDDYADYDAHSKYGMKIEKGIDIQHGCRCHLVIIGKIRPAECPLFMKTCTPQKPIGACMVSVEGTCRIWATTQH
jgi:hydrogenase expression/formation protein HypD